MRTIIHALYSKQLYRDVLLTWNRKRCIKFFTLLAAINLLLLILFNISVVWNHPSAKTFRGLFSLIPTQNPVGTFLARLPKTWEVRRDTGLSVYDANGTPVTTLSDNPLFTLDVSTTPMLPQNASEKYFSLTRNTAYLYYSKTATGKSFNICDIIPKNAASLRCDIITHGGIFDRVNIAADTMMARPLTLLNVRKIAHTISIIGLFILPILVVAAILFLIAEILLTALLLAIALFVFSKIAKRNIPFAKLYMLGIVMQAWNTLFIIITNILPFMSVLKIPVLIVFAGIIVIKFLKENTTDNVNTIQ